MAPRMPACPTMNPARRNMITPRMVKIEGVNTPPNVPNLFLDGGTDSDAESGINDEKQEGLVREICFLGLPIAEPKHPNAQFIQHVQRPRHNDLARNILRGHQHPNN